MQKRLLLFFVLFFVIKSYSQTKITFNPFFKDSSLILDRFYFLENKDSIAFSEIKFYISNVYFTLNNKKVLAEKNSYHLINIGEKNEILIATNKKFDAIHFSIGIDSLTTAKGIKDGDLDPTNGMYWTWQSGYINMKIEGQSNRCATRKNIFQYHIGGFKNEENALQNCSFTTNENNSLQIDFDLYHFIKNIDIANENSIMIPSQKAVAIAHLFSKCFELRK